MKSEDMRAMKGKNYDDLYINREMMKVKAGDFPTWYDNLPGYLQSPYTREFDRLQTKYDNLKII